MKRLEEDRSDFTKGSIPQNIIRMAIPMTVAVLVNSLYNIVDRIYLGHIPGAGSSALAGVGLTFPIILMITAFQNLFGNGGAPLFSMASGKGDKDLARRYLNNAAFMLFFCGIALTAVGYIIKPKVLYLIGASSETFGYANSYLNIYLIGTIFVMLSLGLNPYINAQGYAKVGMFTVIIGAAMNIVLDPLFIFVFKMGVKGAAIATVIAQFCSSLWVLRFFFNKKTPIGIQIRGFRPEGKLIGKIASLGMTEFCFAITNSAVSMVCNSRLQFFGGDAWVGTMTVIASLREVLMSLMHGIAGASRPIMSYNFGAKRYDRVKSTRRWMFGLLLVYYILMWAVLMLFPGFFARLFSDESSVIECCKVGIRLYFLLQFCMAFQSVGQSTFTALGMAKHALFFSLFRKAILVIPIVLVLPNLFGLGVKGVFLAEPISDVIGGLACFITMKISTSKLLKEPEQI